MASLLKELVYCYKGRDAPKCSYERQSINKRDSLKSFLKKAIQVNDEYDYSKVQYVNQHTKVIVSCSKHGDFEITPNNLLNGKGCPKCNQSKGEKLISKILNERQINYISQYVVNSRDCKVRSFVKIDFYLPDYNIFIEFNGEQHYVPKEYFGGELIFNQQIQRDAWVRYFCSQNNIKLIEIPYVLNELQIRKILNEQII